MKTYISILLLLGATIFSFAQVKISDEAISAVTPGITLEVDGKVHIAGASTSTGTGATGTDKVLMRDNTGVIKMAKPEYYSTQMFAGNYTLSGTKYVSTGNFNTIIDVATTNTFTISSSTNLLDQISINNYYTTPTGGASHITIYLILSLENVGTSHIESQIESAITSYNASPYYRSSNHTMVAKALPAGTYRYKLQVRKVAPEATGDHTISFSNTTMSYSRSETAKITL